MRTPAFVIADMLGHIFGFFFALTIQRLKRNAGRIKNNLNGSEYEN